MSGNLQQLYHSITGTLTAPDAVEVRLRELTQAYPYFAAPHFFLLAKTIQHDGDIELLPAKTNLLFNNPHWLEFQLGKFLTPDQPAPTVQAEIETEQIITDTSTPASEIEVDTQVAEVLPTSSLEIVEESNSNVETESSPIEEEVRVTELEQEVLLTSPDAHTEMDPLSAVSEEEPVIEEIVLEAGLDVEPQTAVANEISPIVSNVSSIEEAMSIENEPEPLTAMEETVVTSEPVSDAMQLSISNTVQDQVDASNEQLKSDPLLPLFEPLHTTDYFASVGIRLTDELKPHDRLGLQLKSFTEWLKTMKKLHVVANDLNTEGEAQVPVMAEKSNQQNEVVTEAMAEVLLQQGKTTKAREVYQKLSLLNPTKSAFFADKIEQIGG